MYTVSETAVVTRSGLCDTVSCVISVWTVCDAEMMSKLEVTVTVDRWTNVVGVAVMSTPVIVALSDILDIGVVVTMVTESVETCVKLRLGVVHIVSDVTMVTGETDSIVSTDLVDITMVVGGACCHDDTVTRESPSVDGVGV